MLVIDDGVRRAKAAQLAGRDTVPVEVGSPPEQSIPISLLLSRKPNIELKTADDKAAGGNKSLRSMRQAETPDLLPPIQRGLEVTGS